MVASGPASHSALIIAALVTAVGTLPVGYFPTTPYSEKCLCMLNHTNAAIDIHISKEVGHGSALLIKMTKVRFFVLQQPPLSTPPLLSNQGSRLGPAVAAK